MFAVADSGVERVLTDRPPLWKPGGDRRLGELGGAMDEWALDSARRWSERAYGSARGIDTLTWLPGMPNTREPTSWGRVAR